MAPLWGVSFYPQINTNIENVHEKFLGEQFHVLKRTATALRIQPQQGIIKAFPMGWSFLSTRTINNTSMNNPTPAPETAVQSLAQKCMPFECFCMVHHLPSSNTVYTHLPHSGTARTSADARRKAKKPCNAHFPWRSGRFPFAFRVSPW